MPKINKFMKYFYFSILFVLFLLNCKNEDYRENFIGKYECDFGIIRDVKYPTDPGKTRLISINNSLFEIYDKIKFRSCGSNAPSGYFSNDTMYYNANICVKIK